jgi:hypothetical protein
VQSAAMIGAIAQSKMDDALLLGQRHLAGIVR